MGQRNTFHDSCYSSQNLSNNVTLLSVRKKAIFDEQESNGCRLFIAKLKVENQSCRHVAFVVRSSCKEKFIIKPRYSYVRPRETLEIVVVTRNVAHFVEISKEFFAIFAVPIYDKRQLQKRKLNLLWRAHGTELFPYETTEIHTIPYILPKSNASYHGISCLDRLSKTSYPIRFLSFWWSTFTIRNEDKPVDEETFHLNWPTEGPISHDPHLDQIVSDWHCLCKKIQTQTDNIIDSAKVVAAIFATGSLTVLGMTYIFITDAVPLVSATIITTSDDSAALTSKSSWFSWLKESWMKLF